MKKPDIVRPDQGNRVQEADREAPEEEAERVEQILQEEMQQAAGLRVPLEIDMHRGKSWYEAK